MRKSREREREREMDRLCVSNVLKISFLLKIAQSISLTHSLTDTPTSTLTITNNRYGLGGQGPKNSKLTQAFPQLSRFIVGWVKDTLPTMGDDDDVFPFSSLQINYNYGAARHVDKNNVGPSYITSIGPHTGGKLWTAETYKDESLLLKGITYANNGPGIIDCHNQWKLFNGCAEHETTPFKGIRISFVAFTSCWYNDLSKEVANELEEMGFTAFGVGAIGFIDQIYEQYVVWCSSAKRENFNYNLQ